MAKRGIYLVANLRSQKWCENLIYSIRESGCSLPIRLIHFGGAKINSPYILNDVEFLTYGNFSIEAKQFIENLATVLSDCPLGYLYRYFAWFSDWDEFIYSDNDIVALCNWEDLFNYLDNIDLVHADKEYITNGKYNYNRPELIQDIFGASALESAMTAGHLVVRQNNKMVQDINKAVEWFIKNPDIPKKHDQSLLHVASLIGNWKMLNLCKSPNNWLSSWAGHYRNSLQLVQNIFLNDTKISHLHYSGGNPNGDMAIQELLFSNLNEKERLKTLSVICVRTFSGLENLRKTHLRIKNFFNKR